MNDIIQTLKPVYYVSKIFGQANYKVKYSYGQKMIHPCKKTIAYSIILFVLLSVTSTQAILVTYKSEKQKLLFMMFVLLNIILTCLTLTNNFICNKKIIDILKRLLMLDMKLKTNGINIQYENDRRSIMKILILHVVLIFLYYFLGFFRTGVKITTMFLFKYFCFLIRKSIQIVMLLQVEAFMILLKTRVDALTCKLLEKISAELSILFQTAYFHQEMNAIARNINDFYSRTMAVSTVLIFMVTIMLSFDFIQHNIFFSDLIIAGYNTGVHIIYFYVFIYYCAVITDSVSIYFNYILN